VKTLTDMGMERASHIETGISGWRNDGLAIDSYDEWKAAKPN
jgi:hypothetical protein